MPVERAAYDAAYKGVTDVLTLYLWRRPAFYLTRWAAQAGLTPNMVTAVGAVFCVLAFYLFWIGHYWLGRRRRLRLHGARHGRREARALHRRLVQMGQYLRPRHRPRPPALLVVGVGRTGSRPTADPLEPVYATMLLWAIIGGYVAQRLIEGVFMRRFDGMHIHVWRPIDSKFRLITARRNPNMVILVAALLFGRPDVGLELVALWTIVSLIFHAVRLAQATCRAEPRRAGHLLAGMSRHRPRSCSPDRGRAATRSRAATAPTSRR